MSEKDDDGPAFPSAHHHPNIDWPDYQYGISTRIWLAGQALAGICAHPDTWGLERKGLVAAAYDMADRMIKAGKAPTDDH